MTPEQLNDLYNSCRAGLAMSFTNISLVPEEMLAAGTVAVTNDDADARAILTNENVVWAPATPEALAQALSRAYQRPDGDQAIIAGSVGQVGWRKAKADVIRILENEVRGS
jgi:hypothetical protein